MAFIMYFFGYSNIYISRTGIKFATLNQTAVFADKSLQWLFWHKSRFATFCFLALIYLFNISNIRILDKALLLIIIESNLYFSNSHTFLALSFVYIIYFLFKKFKNINKYLKVSLFIISLIIILVIFIKLIIPLITNGRNVGSLGNRTFIWRYSIELIKQNPFGNIILNRNSGFILQNRLYINSAHNIFLNEFIESGFLGGILYFLIVILLLKRILSNDKRIFFGVLLILLGGCFDIILFEAMNPIFWYTIAIFYSYNNYQKYNWIGRKIENVPISNSYYNLI
ncbi:O-antigen ligase family protein [Thermoanaerobacterium sp. RBIITD]|uniref:O-antigen ligase family protein n=1 Tax=Thermoanaerobacterium sp. RBIITD TaxID=1550240 RepID=UPI001560D316|nr:O-antigen ligase family protein [Thermoanaerobacterium sp. RBIITD]